MWGEGDGTVRFRLRRPKPCPPLPLPPCDKRQGSRIQTLVITWLVIDVVQSNFCHHGVPRSVSILRVFGHLSFLWRDPPHLSIFIVGFPTVYISNFYHCGIPRSVGIFISGFPTLILYRGIATHWLFVGRTKSLEKLTNFYRGIPRFCFYSGLTDDCHFDRTLRTKAWVLFWPYRTEDSVWDSLFLTCVWESTLRATLSCRTWARSLGTIYLLFEHWPTQSMKL